jgi:hypothetical protein
MTTETTAKPRARRAKQPDVLTQQNMELMPMSQNDMRAPDPAPVVMSSGPMRLLEIAVNRGASVEEIDKLMGLMERHEANEAKREFVAAMVAFKKNAPTIVTNQTGEVRKDGKLQYSYGYADLAEVNDKIIAALAAVNISHNWTQRQADGLLHLTCTITHARGHSVSTTLAAAPDNSGGKNSIQAVGSTNTYLERYTLLALTGIAVRDGSDNDGGTVTHAERQELQGAARNLRQSASQINEQKQAQVKPAPQQLLADARTSADAGRESFGVFWKALNGEKRTQLGPYLADLEQRAKNADGLQGGAK